MKNTILIILVIFLLPLINSCINDDFVNDEINQIIIPDTDFKIVTFIRHGNATVSDSRHISIMNKSEIINNNSVGNMFICDRELNVKVLAYNKDTIKIEYLNQARVFKDNTDIFGVKINYIIKSAQQGDAPETGSSE